jgi:hypothetical protein
MAKTAVLTIQYQGVALANADVFFGDVIQAVKVTDVNGQITATTGDSYAAVEWIAVRSASFPTGTVALAICLFEAGKNYLFNIPQIDAVSPTGTNILIGT